MTTYRRRLDIIADILKVARTGAKKTKIMYFANLSFALLNKYLQDALHVGFLQFDGEKYLMTKKGEDFLQKYGLFTTQYSTVKAHLEKLHGEAEVLDKMYRRRVNGRPARKKGLAVLG